MSGEDARRRELEARNAGLRTQIDSMLSDLQRKQAEAAQRTHEVASEDGMVTARVDATGTLEELTLSPKTFERSSPESLARAITSVVREASGGAQQARQELVNSGPLGRSARSRRTRAASR
ncbi:YbaB/EbfC family nucleoid-associated protein [Haloactinomyces albus]|uniref:DNA-binding protein YbaB n=1 Tax=Haloactinomyces albus TaxID=1352928 RepID=A0AAE4CNV6_9ACTN|nr:YbaB/EbfC family nucleoid-associated protein [Haloactinomyces albus]MDR7302457.1 DNA-binding protein YbaB [Haloactinomyces albus]